MRTSVIKLVVLGASVFAGCKGETKTVENQETLDALKRCEESKKQKDELITSLTNEKAEWLRTQGTAQQGEVVVSIEGTALTVKAVPNGPDGTPRIDPKLAGAASKQFIDVVAKSRGAIQKCYEQALKKDTSIQAKTITLTVEASFSQVGAYQSSSFAPSLGSTFDTCMKAIASKWALTEKSPAMRFKAQVSLTPS